MKDNHYQKIGIIGGGQLAMFLAKACLKLNLETIILENFSDCSAKPFASQFILGKLDNKESLDKLFNIADCVIFENENLDTVLLSSLEQKYPGKLVQTSIIMEISQNRLHEKSFLNNLNIPIANFFLIHSYQDVVMASQIFNSDVIIKTTRFGYDGKNQIYLKKNELSSKETYINNLISNNECIVEKVCDFEYEISLIGTYSNHKITSCLPITKNIHKNGILFKSEILNDDNLFIQAKDIFQKIITNLPGIGTLTVEFFVDKDHKLLVNELAPRVHNSGHHSLDNCLYSQFDITIMNILNILKPNKVLKEWSMFNILGQHYQYFKNYKPKTNEYIFYDYYKKDLKSNRKMAHINTSEHLDNLIK